MYKITKDNGIIKETIAPPTDPSITGIDPPPELPSLSTQLKTPYTLLHFTEVSSLFTSSHTCSPLPLTLKPLEQFSEQLEP